MRKTLATGLAGLGQLHIGGIVSRIPAWFGASVLLALVVSTAGCAAGQPGSAASDATSKASAAASSAPSAVATAAPRPVERQIPLAEFGSAKAGWHKTLVSVTVRDDVLVVKVKRELTHDETDAIVSAAEAFQKKVGPSLARLQIQDAESGYLLTYRSLG
jgi:hypothetical protein